MPPFELYDRVAFNDKDIRKTADGYLIATPRVARTGIQLYAGKEVGRPNMDVVRVYRPESEVFNKDSLHTFAYRPITNDHPPVLVDSSNWKKYADGISGGDVARDGEFVRVPMTLMDHNVIKDVEDGKAELSVGYLADVDFQSGTDPTTGEQYDAIQKNIRVNHIAVVGKARGGGKLKIGDNNADEDTTNLIRGDTKPSKGEETMNDKTNFVTVDVDSIPVQVVGDIAASTLRKRLSQLGSEIDDLNKRLEADASKAKAKETEDAAKIKELSDAAVKKDTEIADLKKKLEDSAMTPAKLDALVKDREAVIKKAKAVLGDKLVSDGKTVEEIKRQVVDAHLGDKAKEYTADHVMIAFDTINVEDDGSSVNRQSGINDTARAFSKPGHVNDASAAYDKYTADLQNAWKAPAAAQ